MTRPTVWETGPIGYRGRLYTLSQQTQFIILQFVLYSVCMDYWKIHKATCKTRE